MKVHPTAIIHPKANLAESVEIGPNVIIAENVTIGARTIVMANAVITGWTEIGTENEIHFGAVIGHAPQHTSYKGEKSYTKIGNKNIIREYVTIHRSFREGEETAIGNNNFLMAMSHVAHDCKIGNNVVIVNGSLLGGHVEIDDMVVISGNVGIHQYVRIGKIAMISGLSRVSKDVPPYCIHAGFNRIRGLNVIGLKRGGYNQDAREKIKLAYKILYRSGLNVNHALEKMESENLGEEVQLLIDFVKESKKGKRGICRHATAEELEEEDEMY